MQPGDLVRFETPKTFFSRGEKWDIGLLIEYNTWEKVARILHDGKIISVHASNVQKAGKKDVARFGSQAVKKNT